MKHYQLEEKMKNNIRLIDHKRRDGEDADEVTKHQPTITTTMKPMSYFLFLFVVVATVMIMSISSRHEHDDSSLLSIDTGRRLRQQKHGTTMQNQHGCTSFDNKPIPSFLHSKNKKHNRISELEMLYHQHFFSFVTDIYPNNLAPGTLSSNDLIINNPNEMTTLVAPKGGRHDDHYANFILWGKHDPRPGTKDIFASVFMTNDHQIQQREVGSYIELNGPRRVHYISPFNGNGNKRREIDRTMAVEGDHIVFFIDYYDTFAHILIDMLPFIAYLRESIMDKTSTKLLLPDTGILRNLIEVWDPEFASHKVSWMDCGRDDAIDPNMSKCRRENIRVNVKDGGSLTVVHPTSSLRHMDYILAFRRWFHQSYSASNNEDEDRYIVYYTRNSQGAGHGRAMDIDQEHQILDWIRRCMEHYQRKETLVVFDGSMPTHDQVDLFRRANMVIGAHGGGLANLLYLPEVNDDCDQRPQVLEFMTSPQSPNVQEGSFGRTYFKIYNTAPWIEYHHILYTSQSTHSTTYIDLQEFQTSLDSMFVSSSSSSSISSRTS